MAEHRESVKTLREKGEQNGPHYVVSPLGANKTSLGKIIEGDIRGIRHSKVYMFAIADSMCYIRQDPEGNGVGQFRIVPLHEQDLTAILSQICTKRGDGTNIYMLLLVLVLCNIAR